MRNRVAALFAVLLACAASACASGGASITLHGKLVLRGNDPFVYAVVVGNDGVWKLEGLPLQRAVALQNRQVNVEGNVVGEQAASGGAGLPVVRVRSLSLTPP